MPVMPASSRRRGTPRASAATGGGWGGGGKGEGLGSEGGGIGMGVVMGVGHGRTPGVAKKGQRKKDEEKGGEEKALPRSGVMQGSRRPGRRTQRMGLPGAPVQLPRLPHRVRARGKRRLGQHHRVRRRVVG